MSSLEKFTDWWQSDDRLAYIIYAILTAGVMLPLLMPGFILTLDMVFVPHTPLPPTVTNSYLLDAGIHFLSLLVPADIIQKLLLLSIIFFAAVGMHKLVASVRTKALADEWAWAPWFAGVFYAVNPFIYERFMAGQYKVLLGYMLLPFVMLACLKFLARPSLARLWPLVLFVTLASICSIHAVGFIAILLLTMTAVSLWRRHTKTYVLAVVKYLALGIAAFLILSSYWLIPAIMGRGEIATSVSSFTATDAAAFATDGGLFGILQLKGFWLEAQGLFMSTRDPLPLSGIWQLILWVLIIIGIRVAWKLQRPIAIIFITISVLSIALAFGGPINSLLGHVIPFFAGYREPQKFVALLALAYAYFSAFGMAATLRFLGQKHEKLASGMLALPLLLLPLLNTPTMLWGFYGQLSPRQYPSDWYSMNQELKQLDHNKHIVFLPWHLYMKFSFTRRIIANPTEKFFDAPVVASNDPEYAGVAPQTVDEIKAKLTDDILPNAPNRTDLGHRLDEQGIGYVLLSKEEKDAHAYLDQQPDLETLRETPNLKLYKVNTSYAAPEENHSEQ